MECNKLLEGYFNFLRKDLSEIRQRDYCRLELPFPKPSGDVVVLTIKDIGNDKRLITEEGFVFEYFFTHGIDLWHLTADSMRELLNNIKKRYKTLEKYEPEFAIEVTSNDIFKGIFQMSNIINELISMKLLITPVTKKPFQGTVESFFNKNNLNFKRNPRIELLIRNHTYHLTFDYLFEKSKTYTKVITSTGIIKDWALNFDQIRKHGNNVKLWALYNDIDGINEDTIYDFLPDYADQVIAWSKDKKKFLELK